MLIKSTNPIANCNLKFSSSEKGVFEGHAAVFNTSDQVNDTMLPGCFDKSLAESTRTKIFINHAQEEIPVGDGELKTDDIGLHIIGKIDMNHKDGPSLYSALKRMAMDGLSQGFTSTQKDYTMKEGFEDNSWMGGNRNFKNVNLKEVSVCSYPCEGLARIASVKSLADELKDLKDAESYLRDVFGMSKSMARGVVSQIKRIALRDADGSNGQIITETGREVLTALSSIRDRLNSI